MFKQSNIVRINAAGEFCYHKYNIPKYPGMFYVKMLWLLDECVRRNIIVTPEDNDTIFILTDEI